MRHFFVALSFSVPGLFAGELNSLTEVEQKAGWQLLFDGKDINQHWRNLGQKNVTGEGWAIEKGVLVKLQGKKAGTSSRAARGRTTSLRGNGSSAPRATTASSTW